MQTYPPSLYIPLSGQARSCLCSRRRLKTLLLHKSLERDTEADTSASPAVDRASLSPHSISIVVRNRHERRLRSHCMSGVKITPEVATIPNLGADRIAAAVGLRREASRQKWNQRDDNAAVRSSKATVVTN